MSQGDDAPIDNAIVEQASHWLMLHWQGTLEPQQQAAFTDWLDQHAEHQRAWARFRALEGDLTCLPPTQSLAVLRQQPLLRRRQALKLLSTLLLTGAAGLAAQRTLPWRELTADLRTATGETLVQHLEDGSELRLNTRTAVNIAYTEQARRIRLVQGEILLNSGHRGPFASRPLIVETGAGEIQALGTRFSVRDLDGITCVNLYEGTLQIRPADAPAQLLNAGQRLWFSARTTGPVGRALPDEIAWSDGYLVVERRPLGQFLADLSRYRVGVLRCDQRIAALPLTGTFPTGDTERVLAALEQALPVKVNRVTRYWVNIVPRE